MRTIFIIILLLWFPILKSESFRSNITLESVAKKYRLEMSVDSMTGEVTLSNVKCQIQIIPGMNVFLFNQSVYELNEYLYKKKGRYFVGSSFLNLVKKVARPSVPVKWTFLGKKEITSLNFKVVIDAGHGGKDTGAIGRKGLTEKRTTLKVAHILKRELEKNGVTVKLTRSSDIFIDLPKRSKVASSIKADLFISLHFNSSRKRSVDGIEVFVYRYRDQKREIYRSKVAKSKVPFKKSILSDDAIFSRSTETNLMRLQLLSSVVESNKAARTILKNLMVGENISNRGVKEANFSVLRNGTCPSVLVELGFLSNSAKEQRLRSKTYCRSLAIRLSKGIIGYHKGTLK
ncbi:MAG: hypothetical protein COA79_05440 [Planctomycetota bacterium]|nr:MAG: hypothetical protein COA79_05440 [Planctomycetota bacterium]